jgi:hypothetical protein
VSVPYHEPTAWLHVEPPLPRRMTIRPAPQTTILAHVVDYAGQPARDARVVYTTRSIK